MANEQLKTLEDKLSYAYDTKIAIHDAIVAKGVDIPEGTVFRDYAAKIGEIESGGVERTIQTNGAWLTDNNSPLLPSSAKPGDIVPICGGTVSVSGFYIYRVGDGADDKNWYMAFSKPLFSNVPEVVKPVFENAPQTYSPAPERTLYAWFIMPDFDVEIAYYSL